jgi:hypothetical protein
VSFLWWLWPLVREVVQTLGSTLATILTVTG